MGCASSTPASPPQVAANTAPATAEEEATPIFDVTTAKVWRSLLPEDADEGLPSQAVGSYMKPGGKIHEDEDEIRDKVSQDVGAVCYPFLGNPDQLCAVVCDGHGENGEAIASFVSSGLIERMSELTNGKHATSSIASALQGAFVETNKSLADSELEGDAQEAGTTATVLLLRADVAVIGWVGDSRCVKG